MFIFNFLAYEDMGSGSGYCSRVGLECFLGDWFLRLMGLACYSCTFLPFCII